MNATNALEPWVQAMAEAAADTQKHRKVRTLAQLKADPRMTGEVWTEEDGFDERAFSYWAVIAEGYNYEGRSTLHHSTIKGLCERLNHHVTKGPRY